MLTVLADSNITHLNTYFNADILGVPINVVAMAGRDITADTIQQHQPAALLIRSVTQVNAGLLEGNESVKYIGSATIGTDHIDQDYLASRNIIFANAAGCSKNSVAQYVLTAILSLRPQYWKSPITLGIIGLGNIGSTLAKYAQSLGWQVLGYDPLLSKSELNNASLNNVLTQSTVISLHVPLTTAQTSQYPTYHLIDAAAFKKMPEETLLVNAARGQVISERALLADLAATNRQVVLDVFEYEPIVSAELLGKLALATPHIAGYTLEGKLRGTQIIYEAFCQCFSEVVIKGSTQKMGQLLPNNPYVWQNLLNSQSGDTHTEQKLADFYDIYQDDEQLQAALNSKSGQVEGKEFDRLRKSYQLRREWLFVSL